MSLRVMVMSTVLVAGLTACDTKPTQIGPGAADRAGPSPSATPRIPIEMPPAIAASKQYRCADNSLAFVDFYADDKSASMRTQKDGRATKVVAPAAGETMVADGFSLKGGRKDSKVTITTPEHPKPLSCHV